MFEYSIAISDRPFELEAMGVEHCDVLNPITPHQVLASKEHTIDAGRRHDWALD